MKHSAIAAARQLGGVDNLPGPVAKLSATVNVAWVNHRGCDRDADVEVSYTFDGDTARVTGFRALTSDPFADSYAFEELVTEAVDELADEGYAEWLADMGHLTGAGQGAGERELAA